MKDEGWRMKKMKVKEEGVKTKDKVKDR